MTRSSGADHGTEALRHVCFDPGRSHGAVDLPRAYLLPERTLHHPRPGLRATGELERETPRDRHRGATNVALELLGRVPDSGDDDTTHEVLAVKSEAATLTSLIIQRIMAERGTNRDELAAMSGVPSSELSAALTGAAPIEDYLIPISEALGVGLPDLKLRVNALRWASSEGWVHARAGFREMHGV